jgi:hypothetical protein
MKGRGQNSDRAAELTGCIGKVAELKQRELDYTTPQMGVYTDLFVQIIDPSVKHQDT